MKIRFMITYWCCPVVGWLAATNFDRRKSPNKNRNGVGVQKKKN